ncbi:MAG: 2-amino-4-hydroxy-6-hydroxymethyldihydropteridine diphosphokinase [Flavobacteriales bacterium]
MNGNLHQVVLSLGANEGDPLHNFTLALLMIQNKIGEVTNYSSDYSSKAWGMKDGTPDFINRIVIVRTALKPKKILKATQKIEKKLGRKQKSKNNQYDDRLIDIDILLFDNRIIDKKKLIVPHPHIQKRRFILEPLVEIIPDYVHPIFKKSIKELLLSCEDKLKVEIIER